MRARLHASLCAAALLLGATILNPSAEAAGVEELRARAQRVADRVTLLERRLADLEARKDGLAAEIGSSSAEIGVLELQLNDAERSVAAARGIVEERAIEVYKASTTGEDLEKLLSAKNMHELELLVEVQAAAQRADADAIERLEEVAATAEGAQDQLERRKSSLLAAEERVAALEDAIAGGLAERQAALADLSDEIERLQAEARRAARAATDEPTLPSALPPPSGDLAARLVGTGPTQTIPDLFTRTGVTFEGEASWYGPGFEGNLTANGDVYDSSLFTAASKTLPLNTYLYIEYQGRGCIVLVNDRGPYVGNRILDLSRGTARAIGMEHAGVGWVTAEVLVRA